MNLHNQILNRYYFKLVQVSQSNRKANKKEDNDMNIIQKRDILVNIVNSSNTINMLADTNSTAPEYVIFLLTVEDLFKNFNLLAKLTKSSNPIQELPNATRQPQTEANDNVNTINTNQLVGDKPEWLFLHKFLDLTKISIDIILGNCLMQEQNAQSRHRHLKGKLQLKCLQIMIIYKNNLENRFLAQITLPLKDQSQALTTSVVCACLFLVERRGSPVRIELSNNIINQQQLLYKIIEQLYKSNTFRYDIN
ncbi:unnamed protein product (macronuclear) [Paramecium tetraurelia]|uniref:COMM domain-containing protein n=1 Tax=Paramecium tetraurelia TaxID=5888 RepID=A0BFZ2_PARTE|nr:uncharacterized protein GSPATT00028494001 [Paramecium tetraurelia]CAK57459.1 unnamed protein product [Paramecium tetraurelia]|eukprot:XP_001424857.1 hypothetical protein (macronuclear) [Paramecium tetraurelia strain d4-2]